ncbi:hypothetical protein WICPIJ_009792 [Wickerhamomyces pijperi]|uniref:Uncharacterized protein n=1 Tax=Wickerhamomyces pijperi TaxID=599730 RepID=A0A9P8PL30_WICPI|nr:hypothetical protein WICPIJ_009792 [Wickerhamomyces pijperi]
MAQLLIYNLVRSDGWWDRLTFVFVQSGGDDVSVVQLGLSTVLRLPRQGVLHPVDIVSGWVNKFCNSKVSTKSEFQIMDLSEVPTSAKVLSTALIPLTPSSKDSWVLKTETSFCMVFCMANLISAVDLEPVAFLNLSKLAMDSLPKSAGNCLCGKPGFKVSAMVKATALPKTTKSNKELAPNLLAPWTETQAASPQAKRPGTTLSLPSSSMVKASPLHLVGIPPML